VFAGGEYQRTKNGKTIVWNNNPRPGDTATWFGDRDREGYATKTGTLTWYTANGTVYARYFGNMVRGKFSGMVNAHSKGRTAHAMFVGGERTTRWVGGPAFSWRVASPRTEASVKPAATPEAPAERPPVVREAESAQPIIIRKQAAQPATTGLPSGEQGEPVPTTAGPTEGGDQSREANSESVREQAVQPPAANAQPPTTGTVRSRPVNRQASNAKSFPEQAAQRPTPNFESLPHPSQTPYVADAERGAPSQIEGTPANEFSLQQASPATPAITLENAPAAPSPRADPEAPAEGPPVDRTQTAQPRLRAVVPPRPEAIRPPNDSSRPAPNPESSPEQAAQPAAEVTPAVASQPSQETAPVPPTSEKAQAESEESQPSNVSPPSSEFATQEVAASPEAGARLTKEEVIRLANAAARARGYNRADYYMAEPRYNAAHKIWSVSYGQRTPDGMEANKRFNVIVDDKTKGTVFELSK
jgi:hypothetical protein